MVPPIPIPIGNMRIANDPVTSISASAGEGNMLGGNVSVVGAGVMVNNSSSKSAILRPLLDKSTNTYTVDHQTS